VVSSNAGHWEKKKKLKFYRTYTSQGGEEKGFFRALKREKGGGNVSARLQSKATEQKGKSRLKGKNFRKKRKGFIPSAIRGGGNTTKKGGQCLYNLEWERKRHERGEKHLLENLPLSRRKSLCARGEGNR